MTTPVVKFTFPARYYSRARQAHDHKLVTLENTHTVLLLSHPSNMGYPGVLDWRPDSPYAGVLSMFEHVPRMRRIIDGQLVPLVASARSIGIQILYVIDGWESAAKYPQWHAIRDRVPGVKRITGPESPNAAWIEPFEADAFMPAYRQGLEELRKVIDIAPPLQPRAEDWVVTKAEQAELLMREKGAWNILCAGFDTHDLLYSEARVSGKFRRFVLRDCTTGPERHDTIAAEALKDAALTVMELAMRGYGALGSDVQAAIREALGQKLN